MGLNLKDESKSVPINFTKDEINLYMKKFRALDTDNKGHITIADLRSCFMVRMSEFFFHVPSLVFFRFSVLFNGIYLSK